MKFLEHNSIFNNLTNELSSIEFYDRALLMREGRELRFFEKENKLLEISKIINDVPNLSERVEDWLDSKFFHLYNGKEFRYTDQVMGMLYVLFLAKNPKFNDVANVFINSTAAEIGRLRRFAKSLCHD